VNDEDFEEVVALERRLLDPATRSSRIDLDELIADDFFEVGRSGRVWTKGEILESLLREQGPTIEIDSVRPRGICQDVILVTYRSRRVGTAQAAPALRSSIWRRRDKKWQILFHQGTPAPP